MRDEKAEYQCLPFWSWNDELKPEELERQISWMKENGIGGFFMHARGGLKTPYLGDDWFRCVEASGKKAKELCMEPYAYDENGWPSGFAGGALLEDIDNHDRYLTVSYGPYDPSAYASYDYKREVLRRVFGGEDVMNLYWHHSGSTADILNPEVVKKFIALTHERYKENDDYGLKGFFTDEPQYFRWGVAFTKMLPPYYEKTYGEDIREKLGLLFLRKEGYREFRYRYWLSMQRLMLDNWAKQVYGFCEKKGYALTGHYVEETSLGNQIMCCGGVMPFYEYETMPGIDWLGRGLPDILSTKQLGSAASQLGKRKRLAETFACCGWDVTPRELKRIGECLYVYGVNRMCVHLTPYAEHGQRKRDYPSHFSPVNPWIASSFKEFNGYFSVLGELLAESDEVVDVAVFNPVRSAYLDFDRNADGFGVKDLDDALSGFLSKMERTGIPFHLLDETIMEGHARVEGDTLVVGKMRYRYVIFPKTLTMGRKAEALFREFADNGGKVLLTDGRPLYLEGKEHDFGFLKSNVTLEEIKEAQPCRAEIDGEVALTLRQDHDGRRFLFLVNRGKDADVRFERKGFRSFREYDILSDSYKRVGADVRLKEFGSKILYLDEEEPAKEEAKPLKALRLEGPFELKKPADNYLTLDTASYSTDGVHYSKKMYHLAILDELLKRRYEGDLYVRYSFEVQEDPGVPMELLVEKDQGSVYFNGALLKNPKPMGVWGNDLFSYELPKPKLGHNEIILKSHYRQGQNVYEALFGEGVTESLKNCLAYDSEIEPVYLKGAFGVFGGFRKGRLPDVMIGEGFKIARQKTSVSSLILDGFPFFRGEIALTKKIIVDDTNIKLVFDKRFQVIRVRVNKEEAGTLLFSNELDISPYLKKGENEIELLLTVSNRNLLGPFHTLQEEDYAVGPDTFERAGTWKDGESPLYRDSYSFVTTII
jgi:hypothetical protein